MFLFCVCLAVITGCAKPQPLPEATPEGLADLIALPSTFTGWIPCEDCERVDIVLNLRPDTLYQLRKTYRSAVGPSKVEAQMGRWRFSPDDNLLILGKEKGRLKTYHVIDRDRLRFVEWEPGDNRSQIQYTLNLSAEVDPFPDVVRMLGMFTSSMDTGYFTECSSSVLFSVDEGGDFETTVQNYMNTPHNANDPLLLSVLGSLGQGADFQAGRDVLFISQFTRFYPNRDCEGNTTTDSITGSRWLLHEINGTLMEPESADEARYLTFEPDGVLHGYGGCNRISGTYLVKGDVFLFNRELSTRVACGSGMDIENQMLRALDESETYRIEEGMLLLLDQHDAVRARFLAGP